MTTRGLGLDRQGIRKIILERLPKRQVPSNINMLIIVLIAGIITSSPLLLGFVSSDLVNSVEKILPV